LGVDAFHQTGAYGHLVYKLALARLARTPTVSVPFYLGVGGYVFDRDSQEDGLDLGVRVPMGVNFDFQRAPVQLFVELALGLDVIHTGPDGRDGFVGGYAGVRYWF
ncbi:MAG: hypothetical protein IT370_29460, partial [Deltaproteobacteria bacterium]|nr:hypothetical protein [Deltaproteobacteria bacterium]